MADNSDVKDFKENFTDVSALSRKLVEKNKRIAELTEKCKWLDITVKRETRYKKDLKAEVARLKNWKALHRAGNPKIKTLAEADRIMGG